MSLQLFTPKPHVVRQLNFKRNLDKRQSDLSSAANRDAASRAVTGSTPPPATSSDSAPNVGDPDSASASKSDRTAPSPTTGTAADTTTKKSGSSTSDKDSANPSNPASSASDTPDTISTSTTTPSRAGSTNPTSPSGSTSPSQGSTSPILGDPFVVSPLGIGNSSRNTPSAATPSVANKTSAASASKPVANTTVQASSIEPASNITSSTVPNGGAHGVHTPPGFSTGASSAQASQSQSDDTGKSVGTIMGILVGALIGAVVLVGVIRMIAKRASRSKSKTDFNDNLFEDRREYGGEADMMSLRSDDSKGPIMASAAQNNNNLNRSTTAVSRAGGPYGPHPPSVIQRHFAAPSAHPQMPSFQPGQVVNYNSQPPQPYGSRPQPPAFLPYPNSDAAYASNAIDPSQGPWAGFSSNHEASNYEKQELHQGYSRPTYPEDEFRAPDSAMSVTYHHQVQQLDFGPPLSIQPNMPAFSLKNPYEDSGPKPADNNESGTPTNPNMQQSYFDRSHPDVAAAVNGNLNANSNFQSSASNLASNNHLSQKDGAETMGASSNQALSVRNGNDFA